MLATSLAKLDSFHLAWAIVNFEYIYTLEVLCVRQVKELLPTQCYEVVRKSLLGSLSLICSQMPQSMGLRELHP